MTPADYDNYLSKLETIEDWSAVTFGDGLIYGTFGTIEPKILHKSVRLIESKSSLFREMLSILGSKAALPSSIPPTMHLQTFPLYNQMVEWRRPENQGFLINHLENLKFGTAPTCYWICDANVTESQTDQIIASVAYRGICKGTCSGCDWFNSLEEISEILGWVYIPLPELTSYDLLVLSESNKGKLKDIDRKLNPLPVEWRDGRAFWPERELNRKRPM